MDPEGFWVILFKAGPDSKVDMRKLATPFFLLCDTLETAKSYAQWEVDHDYPDSEPASLVWTQVVHPCGGSWSAVECAAPGGDTWTLWPAIVTGSLS